MTVRVCIADDHPGLRSHVRRILERGQKIRVIGEASNGREALELVRELRPDVLLLDIEMPVMGGLEAARRIRAEGYPVRTVVLSAYSDPIYMETMRQLGVSAFLSKEDVPARLVQEVLKAGGQQSGPVRSAPPDSGRVVQYSSD